MLEGPRPCTSFVLYSLSIHELQRVQLPVSDHPKCQTYVVAYESLDHIGSKFCLISIVARETYPMFLILCDNVTTPYYPVYALLSVKSSINSTTSENFKPLV